MYAKSPAPALERGVAAVAASASAAAAVVAAPLTMGGRCRTLAPGGGDSSCGTAVPGDANARWPSLAARSR